MLFKTVHKCINIQIIYGRNMFSEDYKTLIGSKIREQRKRKHMTQFMLAEKVNLHEKQISRIEAGQNYPNLISFVKIIETLDLDISNFFAGVNKEKDPLRQNLLNIIKTAADDELKIYSDILNPLKENLQLLKIK